MTIPQHLSAKHRPPGFRGSRGAGYIACLLLIVLSISLKIACINVEMVPETGSQKREASAVRGKDFRVNWANRFDRLSPPEQGQMIVGAVDSLSRGFLNYGDVVAAKWHEVNDQNGDPVPGQELGRIIKESTEDDLPLFNAYEDALEYSLQEIVKGAGLDRSVIDLLRQDIDLYYEVFSGVFYPPETVEDYEHKLSQLNMEVESLGRTLTDELAKYR